MNGLLASQTPRTCWVQPVPKMAHESLQERREAVQFVRQPSILEAFEAQMLEYEQEFSVQLQNVGRSYVFAEAQSVSDFLRDHRTLPQVLLAALPQLRAYFADEVFVLRAAFNEYGTGDLYVDVLWPGEPLEAFRLLDQFGEEWWYANSRSTAGALTFTYRLV